MKNFLKLKLEIQGFKDVDETIKATENIAASYIRQLKQKVINLDVYILELSRLLTRLSRFYHDKSHPLPRQKNNHRKEALLIISSDKALVGGLHHNLINFLLKQKKIYKSLIVIGNKGKQYLDEEKIIIHKLFLDIPAIPSGEDIKQITHYLFNEFTQNNFSKIQILYPEFISLTEQRPILLNFLPFEFNIKNNERSNASDIKPFGLPIFDSSKKVIFNYSLQKYIEVYFYKIIMEARLSEFSARTIAMEYASEKTTRLIQKTTLNYFKERKKSMTQKQLLTFIAHKKVYEK